MNDDEAHADRQQTSRWIRLALWGALGYVAVAQVLLRVRGYLPRDLAMYARAGRWWGDGRNPYTDAFRAAGGDTLSFVYPPGSLPLFWPLGRLSQTVLSAGWFLAGLAALVWTALYFRRQFAPETPRVLAVGVVAAFFPAYFALTYGNAAFLLGPAAAVTHHLMRESSTVGDVVGGVALGVVVAIKPYWALAFATGLLAAHRWRALIAAAAAGAVIALGSILQWDLTVAWLNSVNRVDRLYWTMLSGPSKAVLDVSLVVAWVGIFWWWRRTAEREPDAAFIAGLSSVVVWPRVAPYSYLVLLPVLFFVAGRRGWRHAGLALLGISSPVVWGLIQVGVPALPRLFLYGWTVGVFAAVAYGPGSRHG